GCPRRGGRRGAAAGEAPLPGRGGARHRRRGRAAVRGPRRLTRLAVARAGTRRYFHRPPVVDLHAAEPRRALRGQRPGRGADRARAALRTQRPAAARRVERRGAARVGLPRAARRGRPGMARLHDGRAACRRRPHDLRRVGRCDRARRRGAGAELRPRVVRAGMSVEAVVFDLDGLLLDSEQLWDEAREELAHERGGRWTPEAQRDMMGMSTPERSRYHHDRIGLRESPEEINGLVVERMRALYEQHLPLLPGAVEAVERLGACWPLGLASSSNRPLIDRVLELSGLARWFKVTVSSEEVAHGKPAPDVYLEAARRLGIDTARAAAVEDSRNGIRSARAAGMTGIAIPNPHFPPGEDALAEADLVLGSLDELTPEAVEPAADAHAHGPPRGGASP